MAATKPVAAAQVPKLYILPGARSWEIPPPSGSLLSFVETRGPLALARALASSPLWRQMERAVFIVRKEPAPMLGLFGYFDQAEEARIQSLKSQLENSIVPMRYVSYRQAEAD